MAGKVTRIGDANGNLGNDGVRTYQYDDANRLKQVTEGSLTTQFAYNGDGVRVGKTIGAATTDYLVDLAATLPVVISDTDAVYLYGFCHYSRATLLGGHPFSPVAKPQSRHRNARSPWLSRFTASRRAT